MNHFTDYQGLILGFGIALVPFLYWLRIASSPLSLVPGPWYAQWTGWVLTLHYLRGQRIYYIERLHKKYGAIVRVAPDEVSIIDTEALKTVYTLKETFVKSSFYTKFTTSTNHNIFNTNDIAYHRRIRRLLSNPISESSVLQNHFSLVSSRIDLTIQRMTEEMKTRGAMDIWKWWLFMSTDVIGELSFGESFRMLELGKVNQYVTDIQSAAPLSAVRVTFPALLPLAQIIPIPIFKRARESAKRIRGYAQESIQRYYRNILSNPTNAPQTLFTKVFDAADEDKLSFNEILNNATFYIMAGSDTTSNTLTYLVWSVCQVPDAQAKLVKELNTLPEDYSESDVRKLVYLGYVIEETMRMYPAVGSALPRVVPPGGSRISGYWLPEGTVVAAEAHSVHRNPKIFPNPEKFDPDRWENPTRDMKDAFMAFGRGSRVCLGIHLAYLQLRLATARFFLAFPNARVSSLEGMAVADMTPPKSYLISFPPGRRCLIEEN